MTDSVVSLHGVSGERVRVLERLWQLYAHDLSGHRGVLPDRHGLYPAGRLTQYLEEPDRRCQIITYDSAVAGFALTRAVPSEPRVLGEFFVVRAVRRAGVGRRAAELVLRQDPGRWEIAFQEANAGAARFWRQLATGLVGSAWSEERRPVPGKPELPSETWLTLTL